MNRWMQGLAACLLALGVAPAPAAIAATEAGDFGVLVMAHGGGDAWNSEVTEALEPLQAEFPLEIAFGMADAASLQAGVDRLLARGVDRIGVVRLFVSGESWQERTEQIFGLRPGAPPRPSDMHAGHADSGHGGHSMAFWRVEGDATYAISEEGLMDAPEAGEVLADRARALSTDPAVEDVLVLAHGPADDGENARWLASLDERAEAVRAALPFRRVEVATLREDWPERREAATADIRGFVSRAAAEGGRAIVVPFRVQGFGPYRDVLEGLDYVADERGLVPDPRIASWVRRQALSLRSRLATGPATEQAAP